MYPGNHFNNACQIGNNMQQIIKKYSHTDRSKNNLCNEDYLGDFHGALFQ